MLTTLAIENYRSLRHLVLDLGRLTVVTGANGSGKSSLYRALRLLADTSRNGAVAALARQGRLQSILWAGPETLSRGMRDGSQPVQGTRRQRPVELRLGFASTDLGYCVDFGLPPPPPPRNPSLFALDPEMLSTPRSTAANAPGADPFSDRRRCCPTAPTGPSACGPRTGRGSGWPTRCGRSTAC